MVGHFKIIFTSVIHLTVGKEKQAQMHNPHTLTCIHKYCYTKTCLSLDSLMVVVARLKPKLHKYIEYNLLYNVCSEKLRLMTV